MCPDTPHCDSSRVPSCEWRRLATGQMIPDLTGATGPVQDPLVRKRRRTFAGGPLDINEGAGREPTPRLEHCADLWQRFIGERRVEKHDVEGFDRRLEITARLSHFRLGSLGLQHR